METAGAEPVAFRSLGEGFAAWTLAGSHISKATSAKFSSKAGEAAAAFEKAEGCLANEDIDGALEKSESAAELFRKAGDLGGLADSARLLVRAIRAKAEALRFDGHPQEVVDEVLQDAEDKAEEEFDYFRDVGDKRGEAVMLLATAEVKFDHPRLQKQRAALQAASDGLALCRSEDVVDKAVEVKLLTALAVANIRTNNPKDALAAAAQAVDVSKADGNRQEEGKSHHVLALAYQKVGQFGPLLDSAHQAVEIFQSLDMRRPLALAQQSLAEWCWADGRTKQAVPSATEALNLFRELDAGLGFQALATSTLVHALAEKGDLDEAIRTAEDAVAKYGNAQMPREQAIAFDAAAHAHLLKRSPDDARTAADHSLELCRDVGDPYWEAQALRTLFVVHRYRRQYLEAEQVAKQAADIYETLGDVQQEADMLCLASRARVLAHDGPTAWELAIEAQERYKQLGDKRGHARALLEASRASGDQFDIDGAVGEAYQAHDVFEEAGDVSGQARALLEVAHLCGRRAELAACVEKAKESQALCKGVEDWLGQAAALQLIATAQLKMQDPVEAVKSITEARAICKVADLKRREVAVTLVLVTAQLEALVATGSKMRVEKIERAGKLCREAAMIAARLGDQSLRAQVLLTQAQLHIVNRRCTDAIKACDECEPIFKEDGDRVYEVLSRTMRAEAYFQGGQLDKAGNACNQAIALGTTYKDKSGVERSQEILKSIQKKKESGVQEAATPKARPEMTEEELAVTPGERKPKLTQESIKQLVLKTTENVVGSDVDVHYDSPLMETGMDSLGGVQFRNELVRDTGLNLPASAMFDYPTQRGLVDFMMEEVRRA